MTGTSSLDKSPFTPNFLHPALTRASSGQCQVGVDFLNPGEGFVVPAPYTNLLGLFNRLFFISHYYSSSYHFPCSFSSLYLIQHSGILGLCQRGCCVGAMHSSDFLGCLEGGIILCDRSPRHSHNHILDIVVLLDNAIDFHWTSRTLLVKACTPRGPDTIVASYNCCFFCSSEITE